MRSRTRAVAAAVLVVAWMPGCTLPHEMERVAPVSSHCPERVEPPPAGMVDPTTLRWYRAAQPRDRELSARWCSTVGDIVIRPRPTAAFPGWSSRAGIDVVAWNVFLGGGDILRLLDEELALNCTSTGPVMGLGARPFVLLLQEVWRYSDDLPDARDDDFVPWVMGPDGLTDADPDIVEVAERCGLALVYVPSARNGSDDGPRPREDKGNAILSTLPLSFPIAIDLPFEAGRKVAVGASIGAPDGGAVRMVSVHLDLASTLVRTLLSGNQTRARQASGLIEALATAEADGPPIAATVVGSDLNTLAGNETTLKLMRRAFPESPDWDRLGTRGAFPTDHIHVRSDSAARLVVSDYGRIDDAFGSDHQARRLTLAHPPPGPTGPFQPR